MNLVAKNKYMKITVCDRLLLLLFYFFVVYIYLILISHTHVRFRISVFTIWFKSCIMCIVLCTWQSQVSFSFLCVSTWQMPILDPGHRSTHACTDTLGVNTISSERIGEKIHKRTTEIKIFMVWRKEAVFFSDCRYFLHVICTIWTLLSSFTTRKQKTIFSQKSLTILK